MPKVEAYEVKAGSLIPGTWILNEDDFAQVEYRHTEFRRYYIRVHEAQFSDGYEFLVIVDERMYEPASDEFQTIDYWQDAYIGWASTLLDAWKLIYEDCIY